MYIQTCIESWVAASKGNQRNKGTGKILIIERLKEKEVVRIEEERRISFWIWQKVWFGKSSAQNNCCAIQALES